MLLDDDKTFMPIVRQAACIFWTGYSAYTWSIFSYMRPGGNEH